MAFGKKKQQEPAPAAGSEAAADLEAVQAVYPVASDEPPAAVAEPAAEAEAPVELEPAADEQPAADGDPLASPDALLSMFQTTQIESDDRSVLLEMAGEVDFDDLLEDLQTVAVALGIKIEAA